MGTISRAAIPTAGLGTRLLPVTKEQPKEMLAVFSNGLNGELSLKPVVQLVFEQLYECGVREFCFIVGRGKRAIEDHFTPDSGFMGLLESRGKTAQVREMRKFYERVSSSKISWVNQSEPKGFGDAVLCAESFFQRQPMLVQAGDNHVISRGNDHLRRLLKAKVSGHADATLLLREVADPRQYGVAEVERRVDELVVTGVVEKPSKPRTKLALLPVYAFEPKIFDALHKTKPGRGGEIQLTDAIQWMINRGMKVNAVRLGPREFWLDVGTPEAYFEAMRLSHGIHSKR